MIPAAHLSPHHRDSITLARDTLTDVGFLSSVTPRQRAELVALALDILRTDRQARLGPRATPAPTPRVIVIPLAVFQAGRPRPHRPRILPHTPGDAA